MPLDAASGSARVQRWSAPGCPFAIDYSPELLNKLRLRAVEGLHALPHGGLEVGGILFGRVFPNARSPLRVEIAAERPIECSHAHGPSFVLSEEEQAEISNVLERSRLDSEIAMLSVVGFWISHTRSPLALTPDDVELYKKLFPNPWQVALILKPQNGGPTRAGFFFWAGGNVQAHDPQSDFYADAHLSAAQLQAESAASSEKYQPIARERRDRLAASLPEIAGDPVRLPRTLRLPWVAALMLASALAGGLLIYSVRDFWQPSMTVKGHDPDMNLEIFNAGPTLLIHWNSKSVEVQNASRGELMIRDGNTEQMYPLDLPYLQLGYLRYKAVGSNFTATLRVYGQDGHVEQTNARFAAQ